MIKKNNLCISNRIFDKLLCKLELNTKLSHIILPITENE